MKNQNPVSMSHHGYFCTSPQKGIFQRYPIEVIILNSIPQQELTLNPPGRRLDSYRAHPVYIHRCWVIIGAGG